MYDIGSTTKVKISIIGLPSNRSLSKNSIDFPLFTFVDYYTGTKIYETIIRKEEKVESVILIIYFGPIFENEEKEKRNYFTNWRLQ